MSETFFFDYQLFVKWDFLRQRATITDGLPCQILKLNGQSTSLSLSILHSGACNLPVTRLHTAWTSDAENCRLTLRIFFREECGNNISWKSKCFRSSVGMIRILNPWLLVSFFFTPSRFQWNTLSMDSTPPSKTPNLAVPRHGCEDGANGAYDHVATGG